MRKPEFMLSVKELSLNTWPDFEWLFSRGNGWDFCWCIHFQRPCGLPRSQWLSSRAERGLRNHREKRALAGEKRAHGILVYADDSPVGWCQYGPREELPRFDNSANYRTLALPAVTKRLWRISCFVVDRKYRRRGVAAIALSAALDSIKRQGGGLVEAFPVRDWKDLRRSEFQRRGRVPSFGNVSTHGTVSMFTKEGFKKVAPFGNINVLMRRII